jgi:uncharacterized protein (TIGR02680 family)
MSRPLPQPERSRWQPLRAGLVDVFYYDQEEFWFRDGRLLLRGNNGTGKSKVLAMTLPFLLDGELAPYRVEPDADPSKRMEWNLLLGGEHPHPARLGYTWLELGRRGDDGVAVFCTLGCGLKAVSGRKIADHWFFITRQRVGEQLALVDAAGVALTRDRLGDALGSEGSVHRTATAHRRAVDEALFGLGVQRYAALVDLLIRIRAPQLSKRPSERALSDALTEALPPLDQALVADVAEAFHSLEEDRAELQAMVEARDAAKGYLETYRRYAQSACRRRAARPRQAQTLYDRVSRERSDAEAAHEAARTALGAAERELVELREDAARLSARDRALRESPEARSARELQNAAREAQTAADHAREADEQHRRMRARRDELRRREDEERERLTAAVTALADARAASIEAADAALVAAEYRDRVDDALEAAPVPELRRRAEVLMERQARAIAHVRELVEKWEARRRDVVREHGRLDDLTAEDDEIIRRRDAGTKRLTAAGAELVQASSAYLEAATTFTVSDPAAALAELELWVETLNGPNPLRSAVESAGRSAAAELARADAEQERRQAEADADAAELEAEIARLEAGEHDAPPVPHTRDPVAREGRPGAPLWQLVDFRDELSGEHRAGLEAALEAAGILDAWICPDGRLLDPGSGDVLLDPPAAATPVGDRLAAALRPAVDRDDSQAAAVSDAVVERALSAIGLDESDVGVWVSPTGEFRNGVLRGGWRKPAATFIGRGAREAARRARLAELREQLSRVLERLTTSERERARVAAVRDALDAELADVPSDESIRDCHGLLMAVEQERRLTQERIGQVRDRLATATTAADEAERAASEGAQELGLPTDARQLTAIERGLGDLRTALAGMWPAISEHDRAQAAAELAAQAARTAGHEAQEQSVRADRLRRQAAEHAERHRTLTESVGAAVAELQERLSDVARKLRGNERAHDEAERRRSEALRDEGKQAGRLEQLATELAQATERRREDVEALRRFADIGLVAAALPELELPGEWTVTAALRLARQIEQELTDVDAGDAAWSRAQRRVTDELGALADALRRHGNNASAQLQEEGITVEVVFRGHSTTVPALTTALAQEVEDRERLLNEREREILENHLVNEVASSLQELISDAEGQVAAMNRELAERPTSTGMRLRLQWRPVDGGPEGLAEARERLLRQTADAWSEEDRSSVGKFLQAQIKAVRARDTAGTWLEHLTGALDYRTWHRFTIQRHQGGDWRSATGPASGGERVLAASVPLFAAASSHYASATNPHCPRLVLLDEAFAGVDDDSRAKCLGLLTAFDLDVVMTSEREWGCYPEVPGLAIAHLARVDGIAAVLVTHWEWDGITRTRVERPTPTSAESMQAA